MSNSSLVNYTKLSPNFSMRKTSIKKITIHHMAGNLSVETCGNIFANSARQASSNYGIGSDGRVGLYVEEKNRSWCSSNADNDYQAVTIEVANDGGSPNWHVSDKALNKLIELCIDICKRNGIEKLIYTGDTTGNLTRHNMFVATACPGPYLQSKFPYITDEVNKRLNPTPITEHESNLVKESKEKIYLPANVTSWKVYPLDKSPVVGNQCGVLYPNKFGGLTYEVIEWKIKDVVAIIQTRDYGKVQIYVDKNKTSAKIFKG